MAPRSKRTRESTSGPSEDQIRRWFWNDVAVTRYNSMKNSNIFEGAFMKFSDFAAYRIKEMAEQFHFDNLIGYAPNNVRINHLLIKI